MIDRQTEPASWLTNNPGVSPDLYDRYGPYCILTGLEELGGCFWCGIDVKGGRRYCCAEHSDLYHEYFCWPEASAACLARQKHVCGDCWEIQRLLAHHILPLNGGNRLWNILNRPGNLIGLCASCHGKRHAELAGKKLHIKPEDRVKAAIKAGQIVLLEVGEEYEPNQ